MSDRDNAGLRGPVHICVEETAFPSARFSSTHTYDIDGKLLVNSIKSSDGSDWVTTRTYDSEGRLISVASGSAGEPGSESLYSYDDSGRLLSITNNLRKGSRLDFHYDAQGRKSSIQSFAPGSLENRRNVSFGGSDWDAMQSGSRVSEGGTVVTLFNQNDQPIEAQVRDAQGQIVSRVLRTYGANGQLVEEKPTFENLAPALIENMPAEQQNQMTPEDIKDMSMVMARVMTGRTPAGTTYAYDSQNRLIATRERNMTFDQTTSITYNEHGDKAEERKTYAENSIVPTGVEFSVGEHGAVIPNKPSAQQPPQPPLPEPTVIKYTYQYDAYGNWTQQTATDTTHPNQPPIIRTRQLTYY
ncbi:MAG TPA: RHS repeat domain-containing protein [Candidatus Solibacter sp.]|nr:RHS repeat domain-containing protein [Candidatus Solibacter sp.]